MSKDKGKEQLIQKLSEQLGARLEGFNSFLDESFRQLAELLPFDGDPNVERLLTMAIRASGTAEAYAVLQDHGPYGLAFFMMTEGERLSEGIRIAKESRGLRQTLLDDKCSGCEDKDDCDAYAEATSQAPVDEDGHKILH